MVAPSSATGLLTDDRERNVSADHEKMAVRENQAR